MNHMDFELYNAAVYGNNEVLKEILESKLSVCDQLTPTSYTVLHLASQYGNIACVEEILSTHEALLLKLNSRGETPLHLAARGGHYRVAKALINAAKSSLLQLNHLQSRSSTVLEYLIRKSNVEFETALHEAVRYNHLKLVELFVTEDPFHPHPPNKNDETPLYLACHRGYKDIIKVILDRCVSPTYGGPEGRTALHALTSEHVNRHDCSVKVLLRKRKDLIKITDDYGWTAFHYAADKNHYTIIEDLIDADKSVAYIADRKYKRIALHVAAYKGHVGVMEKLLKYCPDSCDIVDRNGRNILHIAAEVNHKHLIEYVLENCKESNNLLLQKDKHGNTPVHLMAMSGCYIPEVMDNNQLALEALNGKNLTPLDIILSSSDNYLADKAKIRIKPLGKRHWYLGRKMKEKDNETAIIRANRIDDDKEEVEIYRKMRETHVIVAALIAAVSLTSGFAMPGGYDGNAGPNQGSAVLLRKAAFKAFVTTDAIALLCSLSALYIYFMTVFYDKEDVHKVEIAAAATGTLNMLSLIAIMLAFITGTYAVLQHSSALAITILVISSFFFLLGLFFLIRRLPIIMWHFKYQLWERATSFKEEN